MKNIPQKRRTIEKVSLGYYILTLFCVLVNIHDMYSYQVHIRTSSLYLFYYLYSSYVVIYLIFRDKGDLLLHHHLLLFLLLLPLLLFLLLLPLNLIILSLGGFILHPFFYILTRYVKKKTVLNTNPYNVERKAEIQGMTFRKRNPGYERSARLKKRGSKR